MLCFSYLIDAAEFGGSAGAIKGDSGYMNRVWVLLLTFEMVVHSKFKEFLKRYLTSSLSFRYNDSMFYRLGQKTIDNQITRYALDSASFSGIISLYAPPPPPV
jgi:hypothetical protein